MSLLFLSMMLPGCLQDKAGSARAAIEASPEYRAYAALHPTAIIYCVYWNKAVAEAKKAEFARTCGHEVVVRELYQCMGEADNKTFFGLAGYDDARLECARDNYVASANYSAPAGNSSAANPSATVAPTATASPKPTATATPAPTVSAVPTPTPTPTATPVPTCSDGTPFRQCSTRAAGYYCAPDGALVLRPDLCS